MDWMPFDVEKERPISDWEREKQRVERSDRPLEDDPVGNMLPGIFTGAPAHGLGHAIVGEGAAYVFEHFAEYAEGVKERLTNHDPAPAHPHPEPVREPIPMGSGSHMPSVGGHYLE